MNATPRPWQKDAQLRETRKRSGPAVAMAPVETAPAASGAPFIMLRQDQYDQISYIEPANAYQVIQGASVSLTKDQLARTDSVSTKGYFGYSAYNWKAA